MNYDTVYTGHYVNAYNGEGVPLSVTPTTGNMEVVIKKIRKRVHGGVTGADYFLVRKAQYFLIQNKREKGKFKKRKRETDRQRDEVKSRR